MGMLISGVEVPDDDRDYIEQCAKRRHQVSVLYSLRSREDRKAYIANVRRASGDLAGDMLKSEFIAEHERRKAGC